MKFKSFLPLVFALAAAVAFAQSASVIPFQPNPTATTNVAVTGTAGNITLPTAPLTAAGTTQYVLTVVGTQNVFIRCDGVTATVSNAMPILPSSQIVITLPTVTTACSTIAAAAGSTLYATVGGGN